MASKFILSYTPYLIRVTLNKKLATDHCEHFNSEEGNNFEITRVCVVTAVSPSKRTYVMTDFVSIGIFYDCSFG